jgi:ABC-type sulfate transport system permease subunit
LQKRIKELQKHHTKRAKEIVSTLKKQGKNAYQIAAEISWNTRHRSWTFLPPMHKWLTIGEVIANLKYLEEKGAVQRSS